METDGVTENTKKCYNRICFSNKQVRIRRRLSSLCHQNPLRTYEIQTEHPKQICCFFSVLLNTELKLPSDKLSI